MMSHTTVQLPPSVFQYLTVPKLRAGVDSVLEYGGKKLPPGLEWDELPQYFRAAVAAIAVRVDWALAMEELWRCVWPGELIGWSPVSIDNQSTPDFGAHVSIDLCWTDEWFGRCFTRPGQGSASANRRRQPDPDILWLAVSISLQGASIGISLIPSPVGAPDPALFHIDDDAEAWRSVEQGIASQTLDIGPLQQAARQALKWVAESNPGKM